MFNKNKFSGIDFHERSISIAVIRMERGLPVVQDVGRYEMKENILNGSHLSKNELLLTALKDALDTKRLVKKVHLAIPTQNILVRKITSLPDIGENELAKILQFQIGENIHLPFENPIYDFVKIGSLLPSKKGEYLADHPGWEENNDELSLDELAKGIEQHIEGPKSELLLFATSKDFSHDLSEVCKSSGLRPISAEIRGLALQRLLMYVHPNWLNETEMILDVSENSIDIHIFKENWIVFSRMMSFTQNDYFSAEHQDNLMFDEDLLQVSRSQMEIAAARDVGMDRYEDAYLNQIVLEIERAQNFFRYSMNERETEFKRIIVTGDNASQIFEPLKQRMETERLVRIDFSSILANNFTDQRLLDSCSVAIGLAIRGNY